MIGNRAVLRRKLFSGHAVQGFPAVTQDIPQSFNGIGTAKAPSHAHNGYGVGIRFLVPRGKLHS